MATYIVVGEADATVQGAEWLQMVIQGDDAKKKFVERFKAVHTEVDPKQFSWLPVFELFLDYSKDLFAAIPEGRQEEKAKEVESFFALVLSILLMLEEAEHIDRGTTRLCKILNSSTTQYPELRLRLLMNLYNAFSPTLEFRCRVFKYIIDYADAASLFDHVTPYLEYLDSWMVDWDMHLSVDAKKTMYRDLSKYVRKLGKQLDSFHFIKKYHLLFQGDKSSDLSSPEVVESTIQLLTDAISIPSVVQFDDLRTFDTVKALGKSKKPAESNLVKLCEVFFNGSVNDLREFEKTGKDIYKEYNLSPEEAMSKIKLLTLATMARHKSEMTLTEVAKGLEESDEGVERWVVRAVSEGIIDGRIDQLNNKVCIKSAFQRKFEQEEWTFLDDKLTSWIENLESVIKFVGEQKQLREAPTN